MCGLRLLFEAEIARPMSILKAGLEEVCLFARFGEGRFGLWLAEALMNRNATHVWHGLMEARKIFDFFPLLPLFYSGRILDMT